MSNQPNFSAILDKPGTEIERPKPLPAGTYHCIVTGLPEQGESSQKKTPFMRWLLKPIEAKEDVDAEALEVAGGLDGKTIRADYYITDDAAFRLHDFLDHCGAGTREQPARQRIDLTPNCEVLATLRHRATQDGNVFAELAKTAPIE